MPAAAVIPAPIAYIKVVAVKKLVVGFLAEELGPHVAVAKVLYHPSVNPPSYSFNCWEPRYFTLRKLECFRQASARIH